MGRLLCSVFVCLSCHCVHAIEKTDDVGKNPSTKNRDQLDQPKVQSNSAVKGNVIFEDKLPHKGGKKGFAHGSMEVIKDGGITGRTNPKFDGHAANYAVKIDHEDAIYRFEVKISGDVYGGIRVGYHMANCTIKSDSISIGKNPKQNATPVALAKDKWHVVTVTRVGTHVTMRIGDAVIEGEEPKLKPTIDAIRLSVKGDPEGSVSYRNLKIWKAVTAKSKGSDSDTKPPQSSAPNKQGDEELNCAAGKSLYQSDFSKDDLDHAPWQVMHGKWHVRDGALAGIASAEDNHEAALSLMLEVPDKLLVNLSFRLAKNQTFSLCFIGGPGPHGRVQITPKEFYLWMKAGDTGAARVIDYAPLNLATEKWHHLAFIRHGDRLIATIDDEQRIAGRHEKFISPKKRINLCSETADTRFDNISVLNLTEVKASPNLFSKPSYTLKEFWSMREAKYGLVRPTIPKRNSP
jgi:hypothetical protein